MALRGGPSSTVPWRTSTGSPGAPPRVRPVPPLVLQAGHVGEVGTRDEPDVLKEAPPALLASRRGGIWPGRRNRGRCDGTDTAGRCQRGLERARGRATRGRSGDTHREVRGREAESGEQESSGEAPLPREGGHGGKARRLQLPPGRR